MIPAFSHGDPSTRLLNARRGGRNSNRYQLADRSMSLWLPLCPPRRETAGNNDLGKQAEQRKKKQSVLFSFLSCRSTRSGARAHSTWNKNHQHFEMASKKLRLNRNRHHSSTHRLLLLQPPPPPNGARALDFNASSWCSRGVDGAPPGRSVMATIL